MIGKNSSALFFLALGLGLCSALAKAVEPMRLAVVPAVGLAAQVVVHQPSIGSNLDRNERTIIQLPGSNFGAVIISSANAAVKRTQLDTVTTVRTIAPFFDAQEIPTDGDFKLPEVVLEKLKTDGATHALVVTRHRAPTRIKFGNRSIGSGWLTGIGLYIDHHARIRSASTREVTAGILCPFVYLNFSLVNLTDGKSVGHTAIHLNETISAARDTEGNRPWNAVSDSVKVDRLHGLIRKAVAQAVEELFPAPTISEAKTEK